MFSEYSLEITVVVAVLIIAFVALSYFRSYLDKNWLDCKNGDIIQFSTDEIPIDGMIRKEAFQNKTLANPSHGYQVVLRNGRWMVSNGLVEISFKEFWGLGFTEANKKWFTDNPPKDGVPFLAKSDYFKDQKYNPHGVIEANYDLKTESFIGCVWCSEYDCWITQEIDITLWKYKHD